MTIFKKIASLLVLSALVSGLSLAAQAKEHHGKKHHDKKTEASSEHHDAAAGDTTHVIKTKK